MESRLFKDLSPEERREMLEANADAIERLGYSRSLPSKDVENLKEQLMSIQIKIDEEQEVLKEKVKEMNQSIKVNKDQRKKIITKLKSRSEYVEEDCYKMVDDKSREVGYYNRDGKLVYTRVARKDELQKTIFQAIRTGTESK